MDEQLPDMDDNEAGRPFPAEIETDRPDQHAISIDKAFLEVADQSPVMMWITDPDGRCVFLNRG